MWFRRLLVLYTLAVVVQAGLVYLAIRGLYHFAQYQGWVR